MYAYTADPDVVTTRPLPSCLLSQNIVNAGSGGYGMGHRGCLRYIYMASASDQGCEYGKPVLRSVSG